MKKLLSLLLISASTASYAQMIFREDWEEMVLKNRESFEKVVPGMRMQMVGVPLIITNEQGKSFRCLQHVQSTIINVEVDRYMTHEEVTNVDGCQGQLKKGEVNEYLLWNKLYKAEDYLDFVARNYINQFEKNGESVLLIGVTNFQDGRESMEFMRLFDTTKSQFYAVDMFNLGDFGGTIIGRCLSDPSQINIQGLDVYDNVK